MLLQNQKSNQTEITFLQVVYLSGNSAIEIVKADSRSAFQFNNENTCVGRVTDDSTNSTFHFLWPSVRRTV